MTGIRKNHRTDAPLNFLVTAIGSFSTHAVIESLRTIPGNRIVGCNSHPPDWFAASLDVDASHQIPSARSPSAYTQALTKLVHTESIDYVFPLTDPEIDAIDSDRDLLTATPAILCMPSQQATRICRDKLAVHAVFANDSLVRPIPTWLFDDCSRPPCAFPLIAKPRNGRSSEGMFTIEDDTDYAYAQIKAQGKQYILQPKLPGKVCVVDVVRNAATEQRAAMARKELLRTPNGAGTTVEMLCDKHLTGIACRIADMLKINGCINIEFLLHNDEPLLMDINPRFSAGVAFSKLAGYDMVINHFRCFRAEAIDMEINPTHSIWAKRYAEVQTTRRECTK